MSGRGSWIAVAAVGTAVILCVVLATRGPASGRAPAQHPGIPNASEEADAAADAGRIRVAVDVLPAGSLPEWALEVRDSAGAVRQEKGTGACECAIGPLPPGGIRCGIRARGFVGESRRIELEPRQDAAVALTLRQFGRVSGVVRCDGTPVAGLLVRIALPMELAQIRLDLLPEDCGAGMEQAVETDSNGRYRFDNVPPGPGYTLTAAGFDHPPVRAGPVESKAGEETTADITVVAGVHLAGRIVDPNGAPSKGATVNVLQRLDKRGVVTWTDEARARTDEDGRFLTPALSGPASRMLKAWIVVDGVQQIIQFETSPPDRGTKDVGTLAPHPGIVLFELEGPVADPPCTLTVVVTGDPPGMGQTITLTGAAFDREGRIRMAGLPIGEGSYSAMSGDTRAFAQGKFRTTGSDMIVGIPPLKAFEESPPPADTLIVDVAAQDEPAFLILIADGSFVSWRPIERGSREPIVEKVAPGRYTLFVCAGDRYGQREITLIAGQETRTSITPDRVGRSLSVLVLDDGKPVSGATVGVRGFRRESRAMTVPWAETGSDGRAVLRGLPPDTTEMAIVAMTAELGRGRRIDISGKSEVALDLAKSQAED